MISEYKGYITIPVKLVISKLFLPCLSIKEYVMAIPMTFEAPTRALAATSEAIPALRNTEVE